MKCYICPRECGADRDKEEVGVCGCRSDIFIARYAPHYWEEPPLSYKKGSGTIFFSGCNLKCVYCQNSAISVGACGKAVTTEDLYRICHKLKEQGVHNINLVTPTHYTDKLVPLLRRLKDERFPLPIVWNSSGYEKPEAIEALRGLADIFLPDFKYVSEETASRYSKAADYPRVALSAIDKMVEITGGTVIHRGTMRRGVIVRHLILPGHIDESMRALELLHDRYGDKIHISIMNQYTPMEQVKTDFPELYGKITSEEYGRIIDFAEKLGITKAFIQDEGTAEQSFIPPFEV